MVMGRGTGAEGEAGVKGRGMGREAGMGSRGHGNDDSEGAGSWGLGGLIDPSTLRQAQGRHAQDRLRGARPGTGGRDHPHCPYRVRGRLPVPLPSRERGFWSRGAGGHVGPPLRRVWERGFGSRGAGGHVGPPLRRALRQAQESLGEGVWEPGSGRTRGSAPTAGPSSSSGEPRRGGLEPGSGRTRGSAPTAGPSSSSGEPRRGGLEPGSGRTRGSAPTAGVGEGVGESPSPLRQGLRQAQDRLSPLPKWGERDFVRHSTACALRQGREPPSQSSPSAGKRFLSLSLQRC